MNFWKKLFNNRIYEVDYESLTVNHEDEIKKLIKYLDLNWEEECLSPEKNKRAVTTASNKQIRDKIFKGSSQKWKNYKPFLNGIFNNDFFLFDLTINSECTHHLYIIGIRRLP